ncbi:transcriptional regulator [Aliidongia dinghuensis]|uniref:Transcriptional regulator n=1 Tax=Aliidongia dinghuensis TaxID=1867774 RepID=A0A8J3E4M3_9PROT|nr:winged helix-turn-helix domain-containing protein [Aliidongia dinghuensis]GGF28288.1 transcriptional regulator [Aliidongia dinghuensis]
MIPISRTVDGALDGIPLDGKATVVFANCRLLVHARRLFVNGKPAELGDRAVELLIALIEARGQTIGKSEILHRVWPYLPMDEANLRVQMHALRRALGDDRHLIKTVQGRGYRFVADVTILPGEADDTPTAQAHPGPPSSVSVADTNLPLPLGPLIGRTAELVTLSDHVCRRRLVTLVGTGGIGKTRLAVELGLQLSKEFPDGVRLVDLASVTDPAKVPGTTAAALNVPLDDALADNALAPTEAIAAAIGPRRMLLILDNCEHLIEAASTLAATLLGRSPGLSILATSQESLRIPGEQIYRLAPLGLPAADADAREIIGNGMAFGAIELFVERARETDARFVLDSRNAASVVEICRQLDGIPLALEMAAARLPLLGIDGLRAGLGDRLEMLRRNPRAGEARHMTLGAMIEWSHGLLDAAERRVFRRLAIFVDSFSLDAAVAVAGDGASRWEIIEILERLVGKSLLSIEDGAPPRYRLLETLRIYGMARLEESDEREATIARHARHFADLFDQAHEQWETVADAQWVEIYRRELGNVRAALDWATADPAHARLAATIAGPFAIVWYNLGLIAEGRRYAERILATLGRDASPAAARFLRFSNYLWDSSDRRRSLGLLEQSAGLYRQLNDQTDLAPVLATISRLYLRMGRGAEAEAALGEAEALLLATDRGADTRKKSLLGVVTTRSTLAYHRRDFAENARHLARALELAEALGDSVRIANILANMAENEFLGGAVDRAISRGREALALMRSTNRSTHREWALANLAAYLVARGDLGEARTLAEEALGEAQKSGGLIVRLCLQHWALIGAREGRYEAAARLLGFVDHGYREAGERREPTEELIHDALQRALAAAVPPTRLDAWAAEGAQWSEPQAVAFARNRLVQTGRA